MKVSLIVLAAFALSACATVPLTDEEKNVRILWKSDAPRECKEIGKVTAPGLGSLTDEGRESDLKRATYKVGGNTVAVNKTDENRTIYGTAFKCQ